MPSTKENQRVTRSATNAKAVERAVDPLVKRKHEKAKSKRTPKVKIDNNAVEKINDTITLDDDTLNNGEAGSLY